MPYLGNQLWKPLKCSNFLVTCHAWHVLADESSWKPRVKPLNRTKFQVFFFHPDSWRTEAKFTCAWTCWIRCIEKKPRISLALRQRHTTFTPLELHCNMKSKQSLESQRNWKLFSPDLVSFYSIWKVWSRADDLLYQSGGFAPRPWDNKRCCKSHFTSQWSSMQ